MKKYLFRSAVLLFFAAALVAESRIDSEYHIIPDIENGILHVRAEFSNLRSDTLLVGFRTHQDANGSSIDLSRRISSFRVETPGTELRRSGTCVYEIRTGGIDAVTVTWDLDTRHNGYSHEITELTRTSLHMPGLDFFARLEEGCEDGSWVNTEHSGDNLGYDSIRSYRVTIENPPPGWEFVSTYDSVSPRTVYIGDRKGEDILLSAGAYEKTVLELGGAVFTIAVDRGLNIDRARYLDDIGKVLKYYFGVYGSINERNILLVINRGSPLLFGNGGQEKKQNIFVGLTGTDFMIGAGYERNMSTIAHECNHLWILFQAFNVKESCYWFSEGVSNYMAEKALLETGVRSERDFRDYLSFVFMLCNFTNGGLRENLVRASLANPPTAREINLRYNKGAYVAYRIDAGLQRSGSGIEEFLGDLYAEYALTGKEIDNRILADYISARLGDPSIVDNYVNGTDPIPPEDYRGFHRFVSGMVGKVYSAFPLFLKVVLPVLLLIAAALAVILVIFIVRLAVRLVKIIARELRGAGGRGILRAAAVSAGGIIVMAAITVGIFLAVNRSARPVKVTVSPEPYTIEALNAANGDIGIEFNRPMRRKRADYLTTSISWNDEPTLPYRFVWKSDRLLTVDFGRTMASDTEIYFRFDGFQDKRGRPIQPVEVEYR